MADKFVESLLKQKGHDSSELNLLESPLQLEGYLHLKTTDDAGSSYAEGAYIHGVQDYIAAGDDALIVDVLGASGSSGVHDHAFVVAGFTTGDSGRLELLRVSNTEFDYKGQGIYHTGNLSISTLSGVPTSRSLTAGTGLTGGGDLSANRTFNVGAGDGINVNADDVEVDSTVVRTTSINQSISGSKTFSNTLQIGSGDVQSSRVTNLGKLILINNTTDPNVDFRDALAGNSVQLLSDPSAGTLSRKITAGTYELWDEGNDGSGSGLDADLLDGAHGSQYIRSDAHTDASGSINFTDTSGRILGFDADTYQITVHDGQGNFSIKANVSTAEEYVVSGESAGKLHLYTASEGFEFSIFGHDGLVTTAGDPVTYDWAWRFNENGLYRSTNPGTGGGVSNALPAIGNDGKMYPDGGTMTTGRVPYVHSSGYLTNSSALSFSGSTLTVTNLTVTNDGSGSGLDADLLDGQHGSYYLSASSYTAADVLSKLLTVDGSGSGLDADLLDGLSSASYLQTTGDQSAAGVKTFSGRIVITGGNDVSLASTDEPFRIGNTGSANIAIDFNEIQARDNGAAAILNLNIEGGDVRIGGDEIRLVDNGNFVPANNDNGSIGTASRYWSTGYFTTLYVDTLDVGTVDIGTFADESILFANASGDIDEDPGVFVYDDANQQLEVPFIRASATVDETGGTQYPISSFIDHNATNETINAGKHNFYASFNKTGSGTYTSYTATGYWHQAQIDAGQIQNLFGFNSRMQVAEGATVVDMIHFQADTAYNSGYVGTVNERTGFRFRNYNKDVSFTTQYGFKFDAQTYGSSLRAFYSDQNSGSDKFNLYFSGTAKSWSNGQLILGDQGASETASEELVISHNSGGAGIRVKSTGDASLTLEADTGSGSEDNNPYIHMIQDASSVQSWIGHFGNADTSPISSTIAGINANALGVVNINGQLMLGASNKKTYTAVGDGTTELFATNVRIHAHPDSEAETVYLDIASKWAETRNADTMIRLYSQGSSWNDSFRISAESGSGKINLGNNTGNIALQLNATNRILVTPTYVEVNHPLRADSLIVNGSSALHDEVATIHGGFAISIGEGLEFAGDNNYFTTAADARIIRALDTNGSSGQVDGGIVFGGYTTSDDTFVEWLVMRNTAGSGNGTFTWMGNEIWHAGNLAIGDLSGVPTSRTLTAGAGLAGGGDLSADRSFSVNTGDGIAISSDAVAVDSTVVRTSGTQTIGGIKSFTSDLQLNDIGIRFDDASVTDQNFRIRNIDGVLRFDDANEAYSGFNPRLHLYNSGGLVLANTSPGDPGGENLYVGGDVEASTFTGDGSALTDVDSDTLDGQHGSYYLAWANFTGVPSTFTPSSHSHIIADTTGLQTALDAKLASASYTAADVLSKLLTVDGSGSGLDADLLDGLHASSFVQLTGAQSVAGEKTLTNNLRLESTQPALLFSETDTTNDNFKFILYSSSLYLQEIADDEGSVSTVMRWYHGGGLHIGSGGSDPGNDNLHVVGSIRAGDELYLNGATPEIQWQETDGSADEDFRMAMSNGQLWMQTGSAGTSWNTRTRFYQSGGVSFGVSTDPGTNNILVGGDIQVDGFNNNRMLVSSAGAIAERAEFTEDCIPFANSGSPGNLSVNSNLKWDVAGGFLKLADTGGKVIEFDGGDAMITVHDGYGNFNLKAGVDETHTVTDGAGGSHIEMDDGGIITLAVTTAAESAPFTDDYYLKVDGTVGYNTSKGDFLPSSDSTYDLGANSVRWAIGYFDDLTTADINASNQVRLTNTNDVSVSSTNHAFQIGATSGQNIAIDNNEIMSRNNGIAATLSLNYEGGNVSLGNSGVVTVGDSLVTVGQHIRVANDKYIQFDDTATTDENWGISNASGSLRFAQINNAYSGYTPRASFFAAGGFYLGNSTSIEPPAGSLFAEGEVFANEKFMAVVEKYKSVTTVQNWKIAELPASTTATGDYLVIEMMGGRYHGTGKASSKICLSGRDTFTTEYYAFGQINTWTGIRVYNNGGVREVYLYLSAEQYCHAAVRCYATGWGSTRIELFPDPVNVGTTPTGTLVFDSTSDTPDAHIPGTGSGSTLDADTVDGFDASEFVQTSGVQSVDGNKTFTASPYIVTPQPTLFFGETDTTDENWKLLVYNGDFYFQRIDDAYLNPLTSATLYNSGGVYIGGGPSDPGANNLTVQGTLKVGANTVWHAGNDGSGSGLDADTVDGIQASALVQLAGTQTITGSKTFSSALKLERVTPDLRFIETGATADENWRMAMSSGILLWQTLSDAGSALSTVAALYQSGGLFVGTSSSDPGTNNLTARGVIKSITNFSCQPGAGIGYRFWDSDSYKIYMSSSGDVTWGGKLDSTSDYNMYFRMSSGTNRGFVFLNNTTPKAQIDSTGRIYSASGGGIRLESTTMNLSSTDHAFQLGATGGNNLRMDSNKVQAVSNGSAQTLLLNNAGGDIGLGESSYMVGSTGSLKLGDYGIADTRLHLFGGNGLTIESATGSYKTVFYPDTNGHMVIRPGSDTRDLWLSLASDWTNTRDYDVRLRLYGSETGNWNNHFEFLTDGGDCYIDANNGDLFVQRASTTMLHLQSDVVEVTDGKLLITSLNSGKALHSVSTADNQSAMWHLASGGAAVLRLEADTNSKNEYNTAYVHFSQDAGGVEGFVGTSGQQISSPYTAAANPLGTPVTGASTNGFMLGTTGGYDVMVVRQNTLAFKVDGSFNWTYQSLLPSTASTYSLGNTSYPYLYTFTEEVRLNGENKLVFDEDSNLGGISINATFLCSTADLAIGSNSNNNGTGDIFLGHGDTVPGDSTWETLMHIRNDGRISIGAGFDNPTLDFEMIGEMRIRNAEAHPNSGIYFGTHGASSENYSQMIHFSDRNTNAYGHSIIAAGQANPVFDGVTFGDLEDANLYIVRHNASTGGAIQMSFSRTADSVGFGNAQPNTDYQISSTTSNGGNITDNVALRNIASPSVGQGSSLTYTGRTNTSNSNEDVYARTWASITKLGSADYEADFNISVGADQAEHHAVRWNHHGNQILREALGNPVASELTSDGYTNVSDRAAIYVKNEKFVIAYNQGGTVNYLVINLDGSDTTWSVSTTAP